MLTVVLLTRVEGRRWEYCASVAASTRNVSARPLQLAAAGAAAAGQDAATSGRKSSEVGAASSQPTSPSTSSSVRCSSDNGDNTNLAKFFFTELTTNIFPPKPAQGHWLGVEQF